MAEELTWAETRAAQKAMQLLERNPFDVLRASRDPPYFTPDRRSFSKGLGAALSSWLQRHFDHMLEFEIRECFELINAHRPAGVTIGQILPWLPKEWVEWAETNT